MASEFLKRKAAQQAQRVAEKYGAGAYGAAKQNNTQPEKKGGAAASSSGTTSGSASAFLRNKAREQAQRVSEQYGEDAYGGTKWRNAGNSALDSNSLSKLLRQVQDLGTAQQAGSDTLKTSGGYYSRPMSGGDAGDVMGQVGNLAPALREFSVTVEDAVEVLQKAGDDLLIIEDYRNRALSAYQQMPNAQNAETFNKIDAAYKQAQSAYKDSYSKYFAAYTDYKTVENRVGEIISAWQQYEDQQRAAFDSWRGTIREEQVVRSEMEQLEGQIREKESRIGTLKSLTRFRNDALGEQMKQNLAAAQGELEALQNALALLQEEYDWSRYYKYADFANASDFARKSRYVSTANGQTRSPMEIMMGSYTAGSSGWDDPLYEYINGNEEAGAYVSNMAATAYGADNALGAVFGRATESKAESQQMTEDEVAIFNYLYATQGREAAHAYYQYLQEDLNYRQRKEDEKYWSDYAQRRPVLSSVFSTLISPAKGLSYLGQAADFAEDGKIDQNAAYNKFSYVPGTIRGQVAKEIEDSGKWGPVGSFAYQTGMSMADFLYATGITGGTQGLSLAIMGTGAAADTTIAAKDRGLSDGQAFTLGTVAGLAEMVMEKVSLEALLNPNLLRDGSLQYIFKNMLAEGGEEVGTDIINLFADILVAKDQSQWQQSIDTYVSAGKTEEEAFGLAFADQAASMGLDFLGGALSGGVMSGGVAIAFNKNTAQLGQELEKADLDTEDIQAFIDTGLESDPDSDAYYIAQEMQAKVDAGEELTSDDLSRMYQANVQAVADEGRQADELEEERDVTPDRIDAPASLAARMWQEQNQNGGKEYEQRTDLPDGSPEWYDGQGAAEQAGQLAGGAEQRGKTYADQGRTAVERQNRARNLRLERVSSQQLGLENGTETQNIQVVPEEQWDDEMSRVAGRIVNETGKPVTYVVGRIQIRGADGSESYARGVITGDRIIVQADHLRLPIEKIADHEAYHAKSDFAGGSMLNAEIRQHIIETYSEEEFAAVMDRYIDALRGIYDINAARTREEYEAMVRSIEEEVYADAYAGINAFGAGADRFTETVNEKMGQLMLGKQTGQENGVEQPTGPPAERYSYAGQNANTADLDALERAKEMKEAGVADETIRQQTGWHEGMDGKWRFEIDDSRMRYHRAGDARFSEDHPDYARHQELIQKALNGVLTVGEEHELRQLDELWGRERSRLSERVDAGSATLENILRHDELFEAYPQLRKTAVRFADLPEGTRGRYDPGENAITLDKSLRNTPEHTLIHEIQHAIQNAEGFAGGSSTEYWNSKTVAKPEYEAEIRKAKANVEAVEDRFRKEWNDDINLNLAKQYVELDKRYWAEEADGSVLQGLAEQMDQIEQAAEECGWRDLFDDYYVAVGELQMAIERARLNRRTSRDLYQNTAGEIEARDAAARRRMDREARRKAKPAGADEHTVFVEDDDLSLRLGAMFSLDETVESGDALRMTDEDIKAVQSIGRISVNQFSPQNIQTTSRFAEQYWKEMGVKSPFFRAWFGDWRANDRSPLQIANQLGNTRGVQRNEDTGWSIQVSGVVFAETTSHRDSYNIAARRYLPFINDIVKKAILLDSYGIPADKAKSHNSLLMHSLYAVADTGSGPEVLKLYVEEMNNPNATNTSKRAYQLQNIEKYHPAAKGSRGASPLSAAGGIIETVSDLHAFVKNTDKEFSPKPSSKAVNEDGTPKIYYHGTNAQWTAYDLSENVNQMWGEGIYLAETEERARLYGDNVMPFYVRAVYNNRDARREGVQRDHVRMKNGDMLVFSPEQIKSATNNIGTFDPENSDVRFSVDDAEEQQDYTALNAEFQSDQKAYKDNWFRERLGKEGYDKYREAEAERKAREEQEAREKQKQKAREKAEERSARTAARIDAINRAEAKKLETADRPARAKQNLKTRLLDQFSIPAGKKTELARLIDNCADRLIKNGRLVEDDRKHLFDRLYESGVMTEPPNEYFAEAREYLKSGRIYVPDRVVNDFGDDWNDIRRRAFAAGIYLTRSRTADGHAAAGIDMWNHDLATELPGLFDSEETDERAILERIVQVAEEGKAEKYTLPEYTALLAGRGEINTDEFMIEMERRVDWALRAFASEADLEIKLRQKNIKDRAALSRENVRVRARAAAERAERKEMSQRQRDRKELQELQQRTLKTLQWLSKNRNRAPEELRTAFDEVLSDIDLYAVGAANEMQWSSRYKATWQDLAQMYKDARKNDPNFMPSPELERIVARLDGTKIADMDLGALQDLYKAAVGLRTEFYNRNNVINDEMQRLFAEVYSDAKREIEAAPGGFTGGIADKFLNMEQLTPMNVMQRMAGWDPDSTFYAMAKQLEKGEKEIRGYTVRAQKILEQYLKDNEDFVKRADGQGKDAIWYEVEVPQLVQLGMGDKPIFGPTVKVYMTPAQKVHMYLESKNLDNLRHMTGGRTFVNKELYSQGKRQEALAQGTTIRLAPETVRGLVSDLTAEEMELARVLDQYYNSFATQEINRVSNILYGYDKAMGKNYAPIYTNRNYTKTEFGVFDTTAEGVGNLKGRQYAVNPSYNISALDAFERHVDQTARFVGMAIPARNWTTLMNWREENNSTGDVITHKWGEEGKKYIADLITALQAGDDVKTDTISSLANKAQSNYISAVFGANPSIVLKQLGSIPLAGAYLDARNMPTPAQMKNIDRGLISKYTQELEWRTMGYTTPETKQLKDNPNWTQTNKAFRFIFGGGAITAMDGWAASTLWPWAENKVRREHPELEMGTREQIEAGESPFYKKVAEEFDNALSRSQSVSDEIHQGKLRKSKNPITRAFTMFRSDSAQTYNALRQKIGEARFYARSGATDKVVRSAKKAVGTAFLALLVNAAWAEAINFLMALWKNKGKHYRDDEDELTAASVTGEMVSGMVGSFAGVVTWGEELLEVIGNILTGETLYDIETPGMEQLNDIIETVTTAGGDMRELVVGGWDIVKNGGDLGEYLGGHTGQILGSIKDLAVAAATYLPGLPVSNLEAYLVGTLKWISPELGTAYDDLFADVGKGDLSGMEGGALVARVSGILSDRGISDSDGTAEALAGLYEAGHKAAVPGDTPTSVSINGEKQEMGVYQQQSYGMIWSSIVSGALDELISSGRFLEADEENQAKMLSSLYSYAAEQAKAELFEDYEMDAGAEKIESLMDAGLSLHECIAWVSETSGMKQAEKLETLRRWDLTDNEKKAVMGTIIGTDMTTEAGNPSQYAIMMEALSKGLSMNEYLDMRLKGTDVEDYIDLVDDGMDENLAYDFSNRLEEAKAMTDEDEVDDLTRWRICVDFSNDVEDQLTALSIVMTDAQFMKVEIANDFGVVPDAYVTLREIMPRYDADQNGSYKNDEVRSAIDAMTGRYTAEQKAVLWQLTTGSTSSRNNPYSRQVGQRVIDARKAAKEAAKAREEEETESFSQAIANQWSNRG